MEYTIVEVTQDNLEEYPHVVCFINPKHPLHFQKMEWLKKQFAGGLQIKLLYLPGEGRPTGFVEHTSGEECWRGIHADGYRVITCIWTHGKKHQHRGLGKALLDAVEQDAAGTRGVAVVTSDKGFMANKTLFLKQGFEVVEEDGKEQLLVKRFTNAAPPTFNNWREKLKKFEALTMIYTGQCPWVTRFIEECRGALEEFGLSAEFRELKTPREAQNSPSLNSSFALIYRGKLLADRYISVTRFKNILKKDVVGK